MVESLAGCLPDIRSCYRGVGQADERIGIAPGLFQAAMSK